MTIKTKFEAENNCDLGKFRCILDFIDILSYVPVIIFSLNKPTYIIKVKEKGRAIEPLSDIYRHNISTAEYYLRETYLKKVRSKSIFVKQFQKISFDVIIPTFQILETFAEVEMVSEICSIVTKLLPFWNQFFLYRNCLK